MSSRTGFNGISFTVGLGLLVCVCVCVSGSCFGSYTCLLFSSVPQRYFIVNLLHHDFFFFNIGCQLYNLEAQKSICDIVIYLQCLKDLLFFFSFFCCAELNRCLLFLLSSPKEGARS